MAFVSGMKYYFRGIRTLIKHKKAISGKNAIKNHIAAELIRNTHSMEKGMCISEPRLGYGHEKQKQMMNDIMALYDSNNTYHKEAVAMAIDSLKEYLNYHAQNNYSDDFIDELEEFVDKYRDLSYGDSKGGTLLLKKDSMCFNIPDIENFFKTRHSIRDFDNTAVDEKKLYDALKLAQNAPSACNRQGVRAYLLSEEHGNELKGKLTGIGGFADSVNRFILVTAKLSSYRLDEDNQYIVSASMYAAYLTLTLHLYSMGSCVIQRPVIWTKWWEELRLKYNIDSDEQMVCLLAVGNLKNQCVVPMSNRLNVEEMIKKI